MTTELPPLPEPLRVLEWQHHMFTADQLRAYAAEAVRLARLQALEEAARVLDSVDNYANPMTANDCAAAIRQLKDRT